jgi:transcriptional repressor NrdR
MDELRKMDKIAYVRFASVYREFSDVSQFVDTLESLGGGDSDSEVPAE